MDLYNTHRSLGSGLDGGHVGHAGLSHHSLTNQTLHVKLHHLNWNVVLIGDLDEVLMAETRERL